VKSVTEKLSTDEFFEQGKPEKMTRESIGNYSKHMRLSYGL